MTDRKIKEKRGEARIDNSKNNIIMQSGPFENVIGPAVLQSSILSPLLRVGVHATRIKGTLLPKKSDTSCQGENF